jgi:hypothetical protein
MSWLWSAGTNKAFDHRSPSHFWCLEVGVMISLCPGCHAKVERTKMALSEMNLLLLMLRRERHRKGHEQVMLDFALRRHLNPNLNRETNWSSRGLFFYSSNGLARSTATLWERLNRDKWAMYSCSSHEDLPQKVFHLIQTFFLLGA